MAPALNSSLTAKISAPGVPDSVVQRARLFLSLDKRMDKSVIWINGPGGSGKTTLVASYLKSRARPCLWYSVDAGDADPATFFYYMGLALQEREVGRREVLPLLTPEYLPGIKTFTRRYFEQLFKKLPTPSSIVFDNYQDVSYHASLHEIIAEGLAVIPEGVNIIAISRNYPPPVLMPREDTDKFFFVEWNELRFSFHEAREFAEESLGKAIDTGTLTLMYSKTDGWIAGLLLIMENLKDHAIDYSALKKLPVNEVFNYFSNEVFSRVDSETQDFLLTTAFVPGITSDMAERLTGNRSAELILSKLARNHFFTEKTSQAASAYYYHPLFREFLLSKAVKAFSSDEVKTIRREAAYLLEEAGRVEDTAALFIGAADWNGLIDFIIKLAPSMTLEGRYKPFLDWIAAIPSDVLENWPWLLYWRGVCATPSDPLQAELSMKKALEFFSRQNDRTGMFMSLCGLQDVILNIGAFHLFDEWIDLMEKVLSEDSSFPSRDIEQRVIMNMVSALTCSRPHHPDITLWTDRGFDMLDASTVPLPIKFCTAVHLNIYYLWMGNFSRATRAITLLRSAARGAKIPELFSVWHKAQETLYGLFMSSAEDCITRVTEGLTFTEKCGIQMWDNHMLLCGMLAALQAGDRITFDSLSNRLRMEQAIGLDISFYTWILAAERLCNNDFAGAYDNIGKAIKNIQASGFRTSLPAFYLALVELLIFRGDRSEALKWLFEAKEYADAIKSRFFEYNCELFDAHIEFSDGDEEGGRRRLQKAFAVGRENGYSQALWLVPGFLSDLCIKALEHGVEIDYAKSLISAHGLSHDSPPFHIENWPWLLKIYTLGRFQILRDNKPLVFSGKAQKKPLELLKALISFGGENVTEEQLTDSLWPEADGDLAHSSFNTTLHRLRKLIENDSAIQLQTGRLSLVSKFCWLDVKAFEIICSEIDNSLKSSSHIRDENVIQHQVDKAIHLYAGHFLASDIDQPWTASARKHLRGRFLGIVKKTGGYWMGLGQWGKAAEYYMIGIDTDNLAEECYQGLIICYQRLGQEAKAMEIYNRCRAALSEYLGLSPSTRTEELFESLKKKK